MKKLNFNGGLAGPLVFLYSLYNKDETKLEGRAAVRQSARILDHLDELVVTEAKSEGRVFIRSKENVDLILELEEADFDVLHSVVKKYKPTNSESQVHNKLMEMFEKELEK